MKTGRIYYLKNFTAPKVWDGKYFYCLLTDQVIINGKVEKDTGIDVKDWQGEIYDRERLEYLMV